jgi:hypothetical protein
MNIVGVEPTRCYSHQCGSNFIHPLISRRANWKPTSNFTLYKLSQNFTSKFYIAQSYFGVFNGLNSYCHKKPWDIFTVFFILKLFWKLQKLMDPIEFFNFLLHFMPMMCFLNMFSSFLCTIFVCEYIKKKQLHKWWKF